MESEVEKAKRLIRELNATFQNLEADGVKMNIYVSEPDNLIGVKIVGTFWRLENL